MSKKNEVAVKENTEVVEHEAANLQDWGQADVSSRDIIIPKILAMQGLSDLVSEGKAKLGDFADSVSGEILGSIESPVKFIPFHMEKTWIVSSKNLGENKFEFERYDSVTSENMGRPLQEVVGDKEIKYEYALQFYVLLPHDTSMPYVITFKSTSSRAGRVLSTQMFVRNRAAGLVPPAFTMELGGKKEKNDKGTFVVMEVRPVEKTSDELISECLNWYRVVKEGKTQVAADKDASPVGEYSSENVQF